MPQRAVVRIWVASLHQKSSSVFSTLEFFVLLARKTHKCGWIRTAAALSQKTAQKQPSGLFLAARLAQSTRAHQELQYPNRVLEFLFCRKFSGLGGWIRTASTRRTVRRGKKPLCNSDDRCQRQKQGGAVGAAASRMRVPPKARCSRWEPRPGLLFCAARAIHPRPPNKKNPNLFPIGEGFGFFVFFGYDSNSHI